MGVNRSLAVLLRGCCSRHGLRKEHGLSWSPVVVEGGWYVGVQLCGGLYDGQEGFQNAP
jgi:hypothetical protein